MPDYTGRQTDRPGRRQECVAIVIRVLTIEVERSAKWREAPATARRRRRPKGEPILLPRPVRGSTDAGAFIARQTALPLADRSVESIACLDVLEFIRDEEELIDEFARVLAPGGVLRLRMPAAGPLAGIDAFNMARYLVDITHRGVRPRETSELGWRRHYRPADLQSLLCSARFEIVRVRRRRLALAEAITFAGIVLFRWVRPRRRWFRRVQRIAATIERFEHRISTPFGSIVEVDAIRIRANESGTSTSGTPRP